ncbi:MAG: beta strand repeat-containing protein [Chthoniobacteraceae bacterium]
MKTTPEFPCVPPHAPLPLAALSLAVLWGLATPASALTTFTWNSASRGTSSVPVLWSSGTAWSGGVVPSVSGSSDYALVLYASQNTQTQLDLGTFKLNQVTLLASTSGKNFTVTGTNGSVLEFLKTSDGTTLPSIVTSAGNSYGTISFNVGVTVTDQLTITHNAGGNLYFGGATVNNGGIVLNGLRTVVFNGTMTGSGDITISSGTLSVGAGSTVGRLSTSSAIINNSALVFNRNNSVVQGVDFGSAISGAGTLAQVGSGTLTLNAANSYTGMTYATLGVLVLNNTDGVNPAIAGSLTVNGGVARLGASNQIASTQNLVVTSGTFDLQAANQTVAGAQLTGGVISGSTGVLTSTSDFDLQAGTVSASLGGSSGVRKTTSGLVTLSGSNGYSGATTVSEGTLAVNGSILHSVTTVATGATLTGSGTTGAVTVAGGSVNGAGLYLGATTFKGLSTVSGTTRASSVVVESGTAAFGGSTTSESTLRVSTGAALVNSGTTTATSIEVQSGATLDNAGLVLGDLNVSGLLKGSGTITGAVALSGTLAPGNSPGTTTINGSLTMVAAATLVTEVAGSADGSYDQIKVSGQVQLAGTLDLSTLGGLTMGITITLIENTGSSATTGYFAQIITSGSTYAIGEAGNFSFAVGGTNYLISYGVDADQSGILNDVTLAVVPEPATWAMLIGGLGMLLGFRRRF